MTTEAFLVDWDNASIEEALTDNNAVDRLQALNTILCFLSSINADAKVVDKFLQNHPDALLLEGAGNLPQESAVCILEEHSKRCVCSSKRCNANRTAILKMVVVKGFEYYQPKCQYEHCFLDPHLIELEADIRRWRVQELELRHQILEQAVHVQEIRRSTLSLLACTRSHAAVGHASCQLVQTETHHKELLQKIRCSRRLQFGLLKRIFDGCPRHVCHAASSSVKVEK